MSFYNNYNKTCIILEKRQTKYVVIDPIMTFSDAISILPARMHQKQDGNQLCNLYWLNIIIIGTNKQQFKANYNYQN